MMNQVSKIVHESIKTFDEANGSLFGGSIYPLVAPLGVDGFFAVYRVSQNPKLTKDGVNDIRVEIVLVGEDYDALCIHVDALEVVFTEKEGFFYEATIPGVNPDKPEEIQITISYNLKMI